MNNSKDRRNFLKLLLTGGAVAASAPIAAGQSVSGSTDSEDKIKMLTEDGKLVEVDKKIFDAIEKRKKASKLDIHDFVKPPKK